MRFQCIKYTLDDTPRRAWEVSQSAAGTRRAALRKSDGVANIETVEVDVPVTKAELVDWLNKNCSHGG